MEILTNMYSYFFKVFRPDSVNVNYNLSFAWNIEPCKFEDLFQMESLKGLSDFDTSNFLPAPMDFSNVKEHGTVFEFLNGLVLQADYRGLEPILTSKIMRTLAEHLGSITHRNPMERHSLVQEVMARLNEFSYSYLDNPFFKLKNIYMERLCSTNAAGLCCFKQCLKDLQHKNVSLSQVTQNWQMMTTITGPYYLVTLVKTFPHLAQNTVTGLQTSHQSTRSFLSNSLTWQRGLWGESLSWTRHETWDVFQVLNPYPSLIASYKPLQGFK